MRVLVFPSCNEPGLEIIDALCRHPRVEVFGAASVPEQEDPSVALLGARRAALPSLYDGGFYKALRALCAAWSIDLVFPTVDVVVEALSERELGNARVIAPSSALASMARSKTATYAAVEGLIPVARAFADGKPLPAFAKPDDGSASRGARLLSTVQAVAAARAEGLLVQEWLPGREYTVDCVGDASGELIGLAVRERVAVTAGLARTSRVVRNEAIEAGVRAVAERLRIAGPWFAQLREDAGGVARLMEINVRVGGSSGATRLAGMNIPLLAVLSFSGVSVVAPRVLAGMTVTRRLDRVGDVADFDDVIWDLDDTLLRADGTVDAELVGWLFRFANAGKRQWMVSKNPDPRGAMAAARIPDLFGAVVATDDKLVALPELARTHGIDLGRAVMVNDSNSEKLALERALPALRSFTPDAVWALRC